MPHPLDIALGASIRIQRHVAGFSQERLAEACGVSFQQIQKYERGANRVSFSRLVQIARAMDCTVSQLTRGLGEAEAGRDEDTEYLQLLSEPGAHDLLRTYARMTPTTRRALLEFLSTTPAADVPQKSEL